MDALPSTVAVVDDDESVRGALRRLFRAAGLAVSTFASAEDFLDARAAAPPDCLVLDIRLGALSGFDLLDRLRASGVSTPTIFITGHDDEASRERARRIGAAGYVPKPFDPEALLSLIEAAVSPRT